jgi:cellulose synthase A
VDGDDNEDDVDDLENEFNYTPSRRDDRETQRVEAMMHWQMHGRGEEIDSVTSSRQDPQTPVPLLTNGQPVSGEFPDVSPDHMQVTGSGDGKCVHSIPYVDPHQLV